MTVLLSIKPEFAERIFNGTKKFEFRKSIFNKNVEKVVVYASAPISKVIGEFSVGGILCDSPIGLWEKTGDWAGISESFFYTYFSERKIGYAIRIVHVKKYAKPLCLRECYGVAPPQSFVYLPRITASRSLFDS